MDFLRARAIPALIALALASPVLAAGCGVLDGTYNYTSEPVAGMQPATFNLLVNLKKGDAEKLLKWDAKSAPKSLSPTEPMARPKVTHLSSKVKVEYRPEGSKVTFLNDAGTALADASLDSFGKWSCKDDHLERSSERMAGAGGVVRTEKVEQSVRRKGDALVFADTVTIIDPPGGKPRTNEVRFKAVR